MASQVRSRLWVLSQLWFSSSGTDQVGSSRVNFDLSRARLVFQKNKLVSEKLGKKNKLVSEKLVCFY